MDSDGSFMEWKQSSRYNYWNRTPHRPIEVQKRKNPDEVDASNRTFSVKRRRIDGQNEIEAEPEMDENIEKQKVDYSTDPQIELDDTIAEAVETTKEVTKEAKIDDKELLVSTQTAAVNTNVSPGNVPWLHLLRLLGVEHFCSFIRKKKKQSKTCSFHST